MNTACKKKFSTRCWKIPAKDTGFLKYLVTFVAQKRLEAFEELKKIKMRRLLYKKNGRTRTFMGKVLYLPQMRNTKNYIINYGN